MKHLSSFIIATVVICAVSVWLAITLELLWLPILMIAPRRKEHE